MKKADSGASILVDILDVKQRVEGGKEVGKLTFQFFMWMISSIAITISTGIYLWSEDSGLTCNAPRYLTDRTVQANWVDGSKRFSDVLKIFFTVAIVDVVRQFIMIIAVLRKSAALAAIY